MLESTVHDIEKQGKGKMEEIDLYPEWHNLP